MLSPYIHCGARARAPSDISGAGGDRPAGPAGAVAPAAGGHIWCPPIAAAPTPSLATGRPEPPAGHWPRSAVRGRPVVLGDGSTVLIRPVRSADAPLVADGFARLSARSRQLRFLTPKKDLSPAELRYFTDVDHHDHEGARRAESRRRARCRHRPLHPRRRRPQAAEIAVTVIDDWQGRGSAPNWWLSCLSVPAPKASAASPRWSRPTIQRWQDCCATPGPTLSAAGRAPCSTRSHWGPRAGLSRGPAQRAWSCLPGAE